jgi:dihydrodipicolinate synthase/N-acetylneuraminate lyase
MFMRKLTATDLDNVVAFSIVPFRNHEVDFNAHSKNINYLTQNSSLNVGRKRIIALGGSSLVHHLTSEDQLRLAEVTGEQLGYNAWFISGILPTPPPQVARLVRKQMRLSRPPDAFLLLPPMGCYNPEGVYLEIKRLCQALGDELDARFILYLRDKSLRDVYCRLAAQCEYIVGIKIGTSEDDVKPVREFLQESKAVVWGIGDISTKAAQLGTRGHTSGTGLLAIRLSDLINNAQRKKDFTLAFKLEQNLREFEDIRFMAQRAYNYSAVVTALNMAGFTDVNPGDGGPFNAPPPAEVCERLKIVVQQLSTYHNADT